MCRFKIKTEFTGLKIQISELRHEITNIVKWGNDYYYYVPIQSNDYCLEMKMRKNSETAPFPYV